MTRTAVRAAVTLAALALAAPLAAYPLDGDTATCIRRLVGYRNQQEAKTGLKLPPGALLHTDDVQLNLTGAGATWDLPDHAPDPTLQAALESIFAKRDPSYGAVVIDITDPENVVWGGVRSDYSQYPGSVGKVLCMTALFDGLRRAFPEEKERERILRETMVLAGDWAGGDSHKVPKFDPETGRNHHQTILATDRFALAEWIDHAISPSANGAGTVIWREAMLLRQFGPAYPPNPEDAAKFWKETPKSELTRLSQIVINEPLGAVGADLARIQQGTFWTRASQGKIPGIQSYATPRELARLLLRIEQGRLVDAWSSREMKRYLYMTKKRYRYVYAPELAKSAVYFKSGSLYQCLPEADFKCGKYRGNGKNYMNSIVIVESPAERGPDQRRYIVAMMSNVLRVNSAWDHSRVGAAIDAAVRTRKPVTVDESGGAATISDAGKSD